MYRFITTLTFVGLSAFVCACIGSEEQVEITNATVIMSSGTASVSGEGTDTAKEALKVDSVNALAPNGDRLHDLDGSASLKTLSTGNSSTSADLATKIHCDKCICNMNTNVCDCTGCTID